MKNTKIVAITLAVTFGLFAIFSFKNAESKSNGTTEYKTITVIESIVPMGMGRSRMIEEKTPMDYKKLTTQKSSEVVKGKKKKVKRSDAKIDAYAETKLVNFYSGVGINFGNVASNDAVVTSKLNEMAAQGWSLEFVNSGVESKGAKDDKQGIYVTRYIFKRTK